MDGKDKRNAKMARNQILGYRTSLSAWASKKKLHGYMDNIFLTRLLKKEREKWDFKQNEKKIGYLQGVAGDGSNALCMCNI